MAETPPVLLFHYSADAGLSADVAFSEKQPVFADFVHVRPDGPHGPHGPYLEAEGRQVIAWEAPGNIYAKRGSLSLFWRSREPAGSIEFPVFRVGYADHTSWDMTWLRVDWNGHGFDTFVTDVNLARLRVSHDLGRRLDSDEWVHLAVTWDERYGMKFYVNGELAGTVRQPAMLDAGLSFFGPHSRIISAFNVQSMFNFQRGGDVDEIRIYDRMLAPRSVRSLSANRTTDSLIAESLEGSQAIWAKHHGWEDEPPPYLASSDTTLRRVEFENAIDVKQFLWRGNDGIRETTWPGVYNRSTLPGRTDYFILPDWNVYSTGGRSVTFTLPNECSNRIEIQGAASGTLEHAAKPGAERVTIARRAAGVERTTHTTESLCGGDLTFTNDVPETPIQEIGAYRVSAGSASDDALTFTYTVGSDAVSAFPELDDLAEFIDGRHTADDRATVVASPAGVPPRPAATSLEQRSPIVHVLIPYGFTESRPAEPYRRFSASTFTWNQLDAGLDGIVLEIPAIDIEATHERGLYPLNIRVKDPIWPARDMLDVNVSVRPGEVREVFLDTRDRILPVDTSLYLTLAGAGAGLDAADLVGMRVRLVFKDREMALLEHVADRFQQVRDQWGFIVEPQPVNRRLPSLERAYRDIYDLLRVDPTHELGLAYWRDMVRMQPPPETELEDVPDGVPRWAVRQVRALSLYREFAQWWIDNRFVGGEFGGGLSDDSDFMNYWPGLKLMGADPEPLERTHRELVEAIYRNGMMTNGLPTIMTDDLHTYEEGINANAQAMLMDWSDPIVVERLMSTAQHLSRLSEVNSAGHRHLISNYYGADRIAREHPWEWTGWLSYFNLNPNLMLVEYNGNEEQKSLVLEIADGLLAHGRQDDDGNWTFPRDVHWSTDDERGAMGPTPTALQVFWAAYRWTGDPRYLRPVDYIVRTHGIEHIGQISENIVQRSDTSEDWISRFESAARDGQGDEFVRTQSALMTGDLEALADTYEDAIHLSRGRMYLVTEGHFWTDRVDLPTENMQRARMGGVGFTRFMFYPGHRVSWTFEAPSGATDVGIAVTTNDKSRIGIRVFNLADHEVRADMTGWMVEAGEWRVRRGIDEDGDGAIDGSAREDVLNFARGRDIPLRFPARTGYVVELQRLEAYAPLSSRPDVAISDHDLVIDGRQVVLTVHSLGRVASPEGVVSIVGRDGSEVEVASFPGLPAPADYVPSTSKVEFVMPESVKASSIRIRVGTDEISVRNNVVRLD